MRRAGLLVGAAMLLGMSCDRAEDAPGEVEPPVAATEAAGSEAPAAAPAPGVSSTRVLFGQSAGFSGSVAALAIGMRLGIETAFHEANGRGGVHGRRLELVSRDDGYEPEAAIANTWHFIENEPVFALIGGVGTSTTRSVVPVAATADLPYVAPQTGAAFLRDGTWSTVLNVRASYDREAEEIVTRLTEDLQIDRIAVLYQDDSYGRAGYDGVRRALARRALEPASSGLYRRNTLAVKSAMYEIGRGDPQALIIFGTPPQIAESISWSRQLGLDTMLFSLSPVGDSLQSALGPAAAGIYVTQVVPIPTLDSLPVTGAFRRALAAHDPKAAPGFVSLEGYLAGRLAITGLERCGRTLTRSCFMDSLRREPIDMDGFQVSYQDGNNMGSELVFLTRIGSDGEYRLVGTLPGAARPSR